MPKPKVIKKRLTPRIDAVSVLYSVDNQPLENWDTKVRNGHIKRIHDEELQCMVLQLKGAMLDTTYITTPSFPKNELNMSLPILVLVIKNVNEPVSFEIQVVDGTGIRRRFRLGTGFTEMNLKPYTCALPLKLQPGWNYLQINLPDILWKSYGTAYSETSRVMIHPNCLLQRIYFCDRICAPEQMPKEFKSYSAYCTP
ncbi:cilia- and flagella-associated protein 20-like [Teleopsis dalmanni]|uniref:cilia- and flagella-associated protein 20-like n=1 Tax=Teleopsis dalmanni TaxID=139649 RepID=UPI0018CE65DE|nr:cilia- and flagella-associated protein 20-like [Teleopsis dalmanni]XP_037956860.1 cilia- and flagella-associated protein 20-like [Teleopsis dalmanni]